jgi:hypothetical protein
VGPDAARRQDVHVGEKRKKNKRTAGGKIWVCATGLFLLPAADLLRFLYRLFFGSGFHRGFGSGFARGSYHPYRVPVWRQLEA